MPEWLSATEKGKEREVNCLFTIPIIPLKGHTARLNIQSGAEPPHLPFGITNPTGEKVSGNTTFFS